MQCYCEVDIMLVKQIISLESLDNICIWIEILSFLYSREILSHELLDLTSQQAILVLMMVVSYTQ